MGKKSRRRPAAPKAIPQQQQQVAIIESKDEIKCWECKTVCQDLKNCAKCEAAQYCSKECQLSAWNKGHKHKCKLLGCQYAELENSLKAMDEYHNNSGNGNKFVKKGFSLSNEIDFHILGVAFTFGLPKPAGEDEVIDWGIPSMRQYYENLEKIALGEIWFFPNATEERYREARLEYQSEYQYFTFLCEALCFGDGMFSNGFVQKVCDAMFEGVEMPASIFMDIYFKRGQNNNKSKNSASDRFRLRREQKRKILQFFMEKLHTT